MKVSGKVTRAAAGGGKTSKTTGAAFSPAAGVTGHGAPDRASTSADGMSASGVRSGHEAAPSAAAGQTDGVTALSALISLQADGGGKGRMIANAQLMLDLLETVQDGLLNDGVRVRDLEHLANIARAKGAPADPALRAIYDQITLRARVELAKLGR